MTTAKGKSLLVIFGQIMFVLIAVKIAMVNLSQPGSLHTSDFLVAFYTAGYLVATGQSADLYLTPGVTTFAYSPFSQTALALLLYAPRGLVAIWGYSPVNALVFVPFSFLSPQAAMILWQLTCVATLWLACMILGHLTTRYRGSELFWLCFLAAPIFQAIYMGQVAIPFGFLPLALGLFLLMSKRKDFVAGLALSATSFNPKYFPIAFAFTLLLLIKRRHLPLVGLLLGFAIFITANLTLFPTSVFHGWVHSMHVMENEFYDPFFVPPPPHLFASLPAAILIAVPAELRLSAKIPVYLLSVVIGSIVFWICIKFFRGGTKEELVMRVCFAILCFAVPILEPHLLAYDLTALVLSTILIIGSDWPPACREDLFMLIAIVWIAIDVNFLLYSFCAIRLPPFVLVAVLLELLRRLIIVMQRLEPAKPEVAKSC
ncbi:MAG: DUF2029 domain-containing protein [Cyanobacteria bacterium]|nr:DUF2029 domain-containing protein [Cyanobacteriota bacterium]